MDAAPVNVRMPPELLAALDRYIAEECPGTSRPEAMRLQFRGWAIGRGYLAHEDGC